MKNYFALGADAVGKREHVRGHEEYRSVTVRAHQPVLLELQPIARLEAKPR